MLRRCSSHGLQLLWLVGLVSLCGCGQSEDKPPTGASASGEPKPPVAVQEKPTKAMPVSAPRHSPFNEAILLEPPEGENRPPDKTVAGKDVAGIFERIVGKDGAPGLWESISFAGSDGKPLRTSALLKTDRGVIEIELYPQVAPNHVRSFIALARAGYFDGLPFHRSVRQEMSDKTLAYLETGCPLGTGEPGFGSVGYWLKPEISGSLIHEDGTVGAYHGEEVEAAACRFYITLGRSPWMDGNYTIFGKISHGLDVAHTINKRPTTADDTPREPVIIREVTIIQR